MTQYIQPGASQWIGQPMRRIEDAKLLTGLGQYTDDLNLPGQLHAAFVRSPHAHARIAALDIQTARSAPGVVAIYTGADLRAAGLGPVPYTQLHLFITDSDNGCVLIATLPHPGMTI